MNSASSSSERRPDGSLSESDDGGHPESSSQGVQRSTYQPSSASKGGRSSEATQVYYFLKKHAWLRKRSWKSSICEILCPLIVALVIWPFINALNSLITDVPTELNHEIVAIDTLDLAMIFSCNMSCVLAVAPDTTEVRDLMSDILDTLHEYWILSERQMDAHYLASEDEVTSYYNTHADTTFAGLVFDPDNLESDYTLRMNFSSLQLNEFTLASQQINEEFNASNSAASSAGFLGLQQAVEQTLIGRQGNANATSAMPIYSLQNAPTKSYRAAIGGLGSVFLSFSPGLYMWAWIPTMCVTASALVQERASKIKEALKMSGASERAYWVSWLIALLIPVTVVNLCLFAVGIPAASFGSKSSVVLIFFMFEVYAISTASFSFLIASLIKSPRAAAAGTFGVIYILNSSLAFLGNLPTGVKYGLSLLSPIGFSNFVFNMNGLVFLREEEFNITTLNDPEYPVIWYLLITLLDTPLYLFLAWYVSQISPGDVGVAKPWYFLCACGKKRSAGTAGKQVPIELLETRDEEADPYADLVAEAQAEETARHRDAPLVSVRGLCKIYPNSDFLAVNNVNLSLYGDSIYVLLGHNGAGKSTTIGALTCLLPISAGYAAINGHNVSQDPASVRASIGVCPQENILFDSLTAREHMVLFAGACRGMASKDIPATVDRLLADCDLTSHQHKLSKELSGGMKRRLSLAIALIGDPQVLFLDEPTSGVDPVLRRGIWETLQNLKRAGRCIVLTTHNMDEADALGDVIAIMSHGKLKAYGSKLRLKNQHGTGYKLTLHTPNTDDATVAHITELVRSHVPSASDAEVGLETVLYSLPVKDIALFPALLRAIESAIQDDDGRNFALASYDMAMTSLEDVFLELARDDDTGGSDELDHPADHLLIRGPGRNASAATSLLSDRYGPPPNTRKQCAALIKKDCTIFRRSSTVWIFTYVIPLLLLTIAFMSAVLTNAQYRWSLSPSTGELAVQSLAMGALWPTYPPPNAAVSGSDSFNNSWNFAASNPLINPNNGTSPAATQIAAGFDAVYTINDTTVYPSPSDLLTALLNATHLTAAGVFGSAGDYRLIFDPTNPMADASLLNGANNAFRHAFGMPPVTASWQPFDDSIFGSGDSTSPGQSSNQTTPIYICLIFVIISAIVAYSILAEKELLIKSQVLMLTVSRRTYWLARWSFDLIHLFIVSICMLALVLIFDVNAYTSSNLPAFAIVVLLAGTGFLLQTYIFTLLTAKATKGTLVVVILNAISLLPQLVAFFVIASTDAPTWVTDYLPLLPWPPLSGLLSGASSLQALPTVIYTTADAFSWDKGVAKAILSLVGIDIILFVLLMVFDRPQADVVRPNRYPPTDNNNEDVDVARERQRVEAMRELPLNQHGVLHIDSLRKQYSPKAVAVHNLSLSLQGRTCFGLLGANGAGKTSLIGTLTRNLIVSQGTASINQATTIQEREDTFMRKAALAVCFQTDTLWPELSPREHLSIYATLRGFSAAEIADSVDSWMTRANLTEHADKRARHLSGGNKRKLCVALATLMGGNCVFLDEPSTGVDPKARRSIWSLVRAISSSPDKVCVLTTHSMEEAAALSTHIGILADGVLRYYGSQDHLRERHGRGYMVSLSLTYDPSWQDQRTGDTNDLVTRLFPGANVIDMSGRTMTFLADTQTSLATAFEGLLEAKDRLGIDEFIVGQASINHLFLRVAATTATTETAT